MVTATNFDEADMDELVTSNPIQIPPQAKEVHDSKKQTPLPASVSDVEAGKGPVLSEWDTVDDAGNPRNWSTQKKAFHTATPAIYGFLLCVLFSLLYTK